MTSPVGRSGVAPPAVPAPAGSADVVAALELARVARAARPSARMQRLGGPLRRVQQIGAALEHRGGRRLDRADAADRRGRRAGAALTRTTIVLSHLQLVDQPHRPRGRVLSPVGR